MISNHRAPVAKKRIPCLHLHSPLRAREPARHPRNCAVLRGRSRLFLRHIRDSGRVVWDLVEVGIATLTSLRRTPACPDSRSSEALRHVQGQKKSVPKKRSGAVEPGTYKKHQKTQYCFCRAGHRAIVQKPLSKSLRHAEASKSKGAWRSRVALESLQ